MVNSLKHFDVWVWEIAVSLLLQIPIPKKTHSENLRKRWVPVILGAAGRQSRPPGKTGGPTGASAGSPSCGRSWTQRASWDRPATTWNTLELSTKNQWIGRIYWKRCGWNTLKPWVFASHPNLVGVSCGCFFINQVWVLKVWGHNRGYMGTIHPHKGSCFPCDSCQMSLHYISKFWWRLEVCHLLDTSTLESCRGNM